MDKGQRSLLTLVGGTKKTHLLQTKKNQPRRTIVTKPPSKNVHEASKLLPPQKLENVDAPFFLGLTAFKNNIAITDVDGDFTYEDLFKRSFYLSMEIKKALRNQENTNRKITLICPNGVSYIIGQWAIWMSGNVVVPLSGQHTDQALEYFIKDSDSALVISAPALLDKVENVVSKVGKPLICQDPELVTKGRFNLDIDKVGHVFLNENLYPKDEAVMMLYLPGINGSNSPFRLFLRHKDLNRELHFTQKVWNMNEDTSVLHALSLYNPFGIIASLMSPMGVGGRVVLLPQFDTLKVWSYLLGIQINGEYVPRTNMYPGVPIHYECLLKRNKEVFTDRKIKNYVFDTCSSRVNLMVNGVDYLNAEIRDEWRNVTGHTIQLF